MSWEQFGNAIEWLGQAGGVVALLVGLIGFLFREKWKQVLSRSLLSELEVIKHDHQRQLESYKVSLIAEAEGHKSRQELKKAIAMKFAVLEFDRLSALEGVVCRFTADALASVNTEPSSKTDAQREAAWQIVRQLTEACNAAGTFLSAEEANRLLTLRVQVMNSIDRFTGPGRPKPPEDAFNGSAKLEAEIESALRDRLRGLREI